MSTNPRQTPTTECPPTETWIRGAIFHPDPDVLVSHRLGYHDYETVSDAQSAYVADEIGLLELEATLENLIDDPHDYDL